MRKIMSEFLQVGEKSYYVWKNKSHPILVSFLERYFDESDLREYIDTGKMSKLDGLDRADEYDKMVAVYAIRWLVSVYNNDVRDYGVPVSDLFFDSGICMDGLPCSVMLSLLYALRESGSVDEMLSKVRKYSMVMSDDEEWSIIDLERDLQPIEIDSIYNNKDEAINIIVPAIRRLRGHLCRFDDHDGGGIEITLP